ncbi:MAG: hypothetical protein WBD64_05245 [Candidatus Zixiibacteriota bacterium]
MPKRQMVFVAFVALLLVVGGAAGWADSDPGELPCLPGQPDQLSPAEEEISTKGPTIPRNMVLLETFGRPT